MVETAFSFKGEVSYATIHNIFGNTLSTDVAVVVQLTAKKIVSYNVLKSTLLYNIIET